MASKQNIPKTPDILGEVLNKSVTPEPVQPSIPESQQSRAPLIQQDIIPVYQQDGRMSESSDAEKVKATFYLSQEAVDALEEVWYRLRRLAKAEKGKVSKSAIVALAVLRTLEELETEGGESHLAGKLLRH